MQIICFIVYFQCDSVHMLGLCDFYVILTFVTVSN